MKTVVCIQPRSQNSHYGRHMYKYMYICVCVIYKYIIYMTVYIFS